MHTLGVARWPTELLNWTQQEGNHGWYWKPTHLPRANKDLGYGGGGPTYICLFINLARFLNIFQMFALTYTDECKSLVPTRHQVNFSLHQMETILYIRKNCTQSKCRVWSPFLVDTSINDPYTEGWGNIVEEAETQELCCGTVFPRNIRSHTKPVSPTWLSKHDLDKHNNRQPSMDGAASGILSPTQRTTGAEGKLCTRRNHLPQGRTWQSVIQYQMASLQACLQANRLRRVYLLRNAYAVLYVCTYVQSNS